jgi:hypothetical protein
VTRSILGIRYLHPNLTLTVSGFLLTNAFYWVTMFILLVLSANGSLHPRCFVSHQTLDETQRSG